MVEKEKGEARGTEREEDRRAAKILWVEDSVNRNGEGILSNNIEPNTPLIF